MRCGRVGGRSVVWRAALQLATILVVVFAGVGELMSANKSDSAAIGKKQIIGATATVKEVGSGIAFPARIDTGAETCSLHVEKVEIQDKTARRVRNVGKTVRFLLKDTEGKTKWAEAIIADAVRVKSSSLGSGEFDHRYKVWLTLEWKDVRKEVLVTLNDRTSMDYPLLVGRNFLRGDFLVDVDRDAEPQPSKPGR